MTMVNQIMNQKFEMNLMDIKCSKTLHPVFFIFKKLLKIFEIFLNEKFLGNFLYQNFLNNIFFKLLFRRVFKRFFQNIPIIR